MSFNIERYINQKSLRHFGLSNSELTTLIIDTATSAETPHTLFSVLKASGLLDITDSDTHGFVDEVFALVKMADEDVFETQMVNFVIDDNTCSQSAFYIPQPLTKTRNPLPVLAFREHILSAIAEHQTIVLVAETGSGKSTQIPQYLHQAGYSSNGKKVVCSQPYRSAVTSIVARVADEMSSPVGQAVGYSVPFVDRTSNQTVIKYVTDTILLTEMLTHPNLDEYSALIIDDAHERTLSTDILLALVKGIASRRPELRVFISSTTFKDLDKFSEYFDNAPVFYVPGTRYPVEVYYSAQSVENYVNAAVATALQTLVAHSKGDILVFLPSKDEIEDAREHLQGAALMLGNNIPELVTYILCDAPPNEIDPQIFERTPSGYRKVVFAIDVATIAMTIPNVAFVIDSGFVQQKVIDPLTGVSSAAIVPCSRLSANMRAVRSACAEPGKTFCLYTKEGYGSAMKEDSVPEIQRADLTMTVLILKSLGVNDLSRFDLLDRPSNGTLMQASDLLYTLEALDGQGELTRFGKQMAEFPLDPMSSRAILKSAEYMCTDEVLTIISMSHEPSPLFHRSKYLRDQAQDNFGRPGGDIFMLLNIWEQWVASKYSEKFCKDSFLRYETLCRVQDVRDHLASRCEQIGITIESNPCPDDTTPIRKAITAGYFAHAAQLQENGETYRTLKGKHEVFIHPSSSLAEGHPKAKTVLYFDLVSSWKTYMRQVMEIERRWLSEVAPHYSL